MTITCTTCHRQDTIDPDDLDAIIMSGWYEDETGTYCEEHIGMMTITGRTYGTRDGQPIYTRRVWRRVIRVEFDFIPGAGERPAQARIWHQVWSPALRRYAVHVDLVVQEDVPTDLDGKVVIVRAGA